MRRAPTVRQEPRRSTANDRMLVSDRSPSGSSPGVAEILALQRSGGNQATLRLLGLQGAPVATIQRMRLTFANPAEVAGTDSASKAVKLPAAEIFVPGVARLEDITSDPVDVRVIAPGPRSAAKLVKVPRAALEALVKAGTSEPDVRKDEQLVAGYRPINAPAFRDGGPSPADVRQGLVGDCRIISALEALARQQPGLLAGAISPHAISPTYTIRLKPSPGPDTPPNSAAAPESFVVTNALPVNRLAQTPELLYALRGSPIADPNAVIPLWPALFEKAFAHMWGGYERLTGALEEPVFLAIGASPGNKLMINFMDEERLKRGHARERLMQAFHQDRLAITTTPRSKQHNYSLVNVAAEGVTVSDPNTERSQYAANEKAPTPFAGRVALFQGNNENLWPMLFTWDEFFDNFKWVYGFR